MSMSTEQGQPSIFIGNEVASQTPPRTQVWYATHLVDGNRSEMMYRSFISFMWGGKHIEDFNLIAITSNNAIQRNISADFSNLTTDLEVVDGQLYWGSHYNANVLELILYTDEITEKQLTLFQNWFKPNIERELILAEHPNRAIMARVSEVPNYSFLPFEKKITRTYGGVTKETSTTMYRGSINLKFEMDDPFWYSINNFLEEKSGIIGKWKNPSFVGNQNRELEDIINSREAFKIIEEDGVPFSSMANKGIRFGTENTINRTQNWARLSTDDDSAATPVTMPELFVNYAFIGGQVELINNYSDTLTNGGKLYYYYAGTAPAKPTLEFSMRIRFDNEQLYIIEPANLFAVNKTSSSGAIQTKSYNTITLTGPSEEYTHNFSFTTPSILTAYNQAIEVLMKAEPNRNNNYQREITDMVELRESIYDNVHHQLIRDAVFMELRDETNLNNITPRGVAFALRRLFRYKPNDGVACNMMHYFRLKLLPAGVTVNNDNNDDLSQYGQNFSQDATMQTVLYELIRMVVNHLSVPTSYLPEGTFTGGAQNPDTLRNIYSVCRGLLRNGNGDESSGAADWSCLVQSNTGRERLKKVVAVLDSIINNDSDDTVTQYSFINDVVNTSRGNGSMGHDNNGVLPSFKFNINSKTGRVITEYKFRVRAASEMNEPNYAYIRPLSAIPFPSDGTQVNFDDDGSFSVSNLNEEAGDMVCSEYLTIDGQNQFDDEGLVAYATESHPEYSYTMSHDLDMAGTDNMSNVKLLYRYMYY